MKLSLFFSLQFLGIAYLNHICWNSLSLGLGYAIPSIFLIAFLTGIIVFPIFALILRDILGGHFNFQNFLESSSEDMAPFPTIPPPPPLHHLLETDMMRIASIARHAKLARALLIQVH